MNHSIYQNEVWEMSYNLGGLLMQKEDRRVQAVSTAAS